MSYVKFKGVRFNFRTSDIREGLHGIPGLNALSVLVFSCYVHDLDEVYVNGLYDLFVNGINVLSINVCPRDVRGMRKLSSNGMNALSIHLFLAMSESTGK